MNAVARPILLGLAFGVVAGTIVLGLALGVVAATIALGLALSVVAATIWATGYRGRRLEAKEHQKALQTWEDESGNPAPAATPDDSSDR